MELSDYVGKELYGTECLNVVCGRCAAHTAFHYEVSEETYKITGFKEIPNNDTVFRLLEAERCSIPLQNVGKFFFMTFEEAQAYCDRLNEEINQKAVRGVYA